MSRMIRQFRHRSESVEDCLDAPEASDIFGHEEFRRGASFYSPNPQGRHYKAVPEYTARGAEMQKLHNASYSGKK